MQVRFLSLIFGSLEFVSSFGIRVSDLINSGLKTPYWGKLCKLLPGLLFRRHRLMGARAPQ